MATFQITGPDGKRYRVQGESAEGALKAVQAMGGGSKKPPAQEQPQQTMGGAATTWLEHAISDLPVVGPAIQAGSDYLGTEVYGRLTGQDPAQMREDIRQRRGQRNEQYPASALSGGIAGNLAAFGGAGATATGAQALGVTGAKLGGRVLNSAVSSGGISAADALARGGDNFDAAEGAIIGGGIGGAIPVVGAGIRAGLGAVGSKVAPTVNAMRNAPQEAERRVGMALTRDQQAGQALNQADEAMARIADVPLINADRGGETTRALARSVANQSPEARSVIEKTASDRFAGQGTRATDFIRKLTGLPADDVAVQDRLRDAARKANAPAYRKAYTEGTNLVKTPELDRLLGSPAVVQAMKNAIKNGKDRAVKDGFGAFNPAVSITDDGRVLFNKVKPGGGTTFPDLQFWDYTKRELDDMASAAGRAGRAGEADTVGGLAKALRDELDRVVPSYKNARAGAAAFFGADDAIEAGKAFLNNRRAIPEARKAYEKFSPAEKAGFATGFASEMIDKIKSVRDRSNVIDQVFKSQAAREQIELVFGPKKAKAVEAYVRVEDLADRLRGAMGNSTTARQLVELGIGAGGGAYLTGDWKGALGGAAVARGARHLGQRIDNNVMQAVAKMLTANDPKALERAVKLASESPKYMQALEAYSKALAAPARGLAVGAN